ncbi:MAG: hypothetical protein DRZ79_03650 [Candidatus Cloacimonadota bacterium]|nr:MAG: hypothetical protein DRZ79_03650 [Candidatus Cloacimonadota bacterium]
MLNNSNIMCSFSILLDISICKKISKTKIYLGGNMKKVFLALLIIIASSIFATTIYDIQYTTEPGTDGTYPSPLVEQEVTVTGIVTANNYYVSGNANRFFMTDPGGGVWHGIFVFNYDAETNIGDEVEVTGTVAEFYGVTELTDVTVSILGNGNPVPDPVSVTTADLASNEANEGVLVRVNNVSVTQLPDEHGQWYVDDGSGACQIDDQCFSYTPPAVGSTFGHIIGVVDYSYGEYGLNPRGEDDIEMTSADKNEVSFSARLNGCFPNPFVPTNSPANISFSVRKNTFVTIEIYNLKGQKVKTLTNRDFNVGSHTISWNGTNENDVSVTSGVYLYKMNADDFTTTQKIVVIK